MPATNDRAIGVYYEHPEWFEPLFAELERRDLPHQHLHAADHTFAIDQAPPPVALVLNRMSPSAYLRGAGHAIFYTLHYLDHLRQMGVRVVNGYRAYLTEISKARQLSLLRSLGLPCPRTRVIHRPADAPSATADLRFPVVVKPNIGGSGAGIRRFDTAAELADAVARAELSLGPDSTGLVQEFIPPADGRIDRVEVLGGRFLYAIGIYTTGETFDLCPADVCRTADEVRAGADAAPDDGAEGEVTGAPTVRPVAPRTPGAEPRARAAGTATAVAAAEDPKARLSVEARTPPPDVIRSVERIATAAGLEVGGVEYVIDDRDGRLYFYDVNALSNFVADPIRVLGFDPVERLVDYLDQEAT